MVRKPPGEAFRRLGVCLFMVRYTMTLAALVAALSSAACSVHISTGPSTAAYRPAQPNGLVWASAPRPHREHRDPAPQNDGRAPDRDGPQLQRPDRQFDAADEMMRDAAADRTPRQLEPTRRHAPQGEQSGIKDRDVVTVGTSSHTGNGPQKPAPDVGPWVQHPKGDDTPSEGGQVGGQDSGEKPASTPARSLPRGDGKLQRIGKNKH